MKRILPCVGVILSCSIAMAKIIDVPRGSTTQPLAAESKQELDAFIDAMLSIAREVQEQPELVKTAPHTTRLGRIDEAAAARKPILRWRPE